MPAHIAIFAPFVVGLLATIATIAIHGVVLHAIVMSLRHDLKRGVLGGRIFLNLTFVMATVMLALTGHLAEIVLWALALFGVGAVADMGAAIYSSAGSYTTSGSDIVVPSEWRLLAPFEAVNGMLMFGVSTGFIFAVVKRLIHARNADE